jgi:hypothetical protein
MDPKHNQADRTHFGRHIDSYGDPLKETAMKSSNLKGSKVKSSGSLPMIKGGGLTGTAGPTESNRTYPKGAKPSMKADFLPSKGKRSKTSYLTGGV